jgi:hypothetical protein
MQVCQTVNFEKKIKAQNLEDTSVAMIVWTICMYNLPHICATLQVAQS